MGNIHLLNRLLMTTPIHDFKYDVFISYARKDGAEKAQQLHKTFKEMRKRAYLDTTFIESGQKWESNLHESLLTSKAVIFVLTAGSVDPGSYCKVEWNMAIEHDIPILPVLIVNDDSKIIENIPKPYSTIQYINLTTDWTAGIDEIIHFVTRYDYLYDLCAELNTLVSQSTARRFIEIIATENAQAKKQLKRRVKVCIPKRQQTEETEFNSFHEAWQHYNGQVLLLGAPGAGKTTTLLNTFANYATKS
jgi:flagellar biosynthesis GTPase FlhF